MIKVLHVDDERAELTLNKIELLRFSSDIEIEWAESGEEAIEKLRKEEYDCVLSDYQMPEMDGFELLKTLRSDGNLIPFIFLTGQGNEQVAAEALRSGADDYFAKDGGIAHYDRLVNSIKRVVQANLNRKERQHTEEALKDSEQRYRTLFDNAGDAIFIHDKDGNILEANKIAFERLGFSREELLSKSLTEIITPEQKARTPEMIKEVTEKGYVLFETAHMRKDGTPISVEMSSRLIEYSAAPAVLSIARDISKRKQAESELRKAHEELERRVRERTADLLKANRKLKNEIAERKKVEQALLDSRQKYRTLLEKLEEGVLLENERGTISFVNPRTIEMLGYHESELIGLHWTEIVPPEEVERIEQELAKRPSGINGKYESSLLCKNGQKIPVIISAKPLFSDKGDYKGVLSVFTDISRIKDVEEQLKSGYQQLERVVEERTKEVNILSNLLETEKAEKAKAEEALRRSETRYHSLFQESADEVYQF